VFRTVGKILIVVLVLLVSYLLTWPVPVEPVSWQAPRDLGLTGQFTENDALSGAPAIALGGFEGPEDAALGADGALYVTTSNGVLLRVDADTVESFAEVPGRPLGIELDHDGSLLVANAFTGIQRVFADGRVVDLLTEVNGVPLVYADDLDVSSDGIIYFSEASTKFGAAAWNGSYQASLLDILEHGGHGRVIAFDTFSGETRIVIDSLDFANGIALSEDESFLLVAETGAYRILKHWLRGPDAGSTEVLIDNLPGFPDNINNGTDDRFWVGLVAPRDAKLDGLSDKPLLRKIVQRLPAFARPKARPSSHVIAISDLGLVLTSLQDPAAVYPAMTGVCETDDRLYLTRLFGHELPYVEKNGLVRQ
jgi:sugar lactone lactonase YvrE